MVGLLRLVLIFLFCVPLAAEIKVEAEADKSDHYANLPVPITIIITHPPKEKIDEASFVLGKKNIAVTKVQDVGDINGQDDIMSIYRYDLPDIDKGLHVLPVMTVKIGQKLYRSIASTFEVKEMRASAATPTPTAGAAAATVQTSSLNAFLKLENIVQGATTLYPGQMITVGYRYSYNANIETTTEVTPLFEPPGFLKIGDKIVAHKDTADTSVLEVTQQLEAQTPGVYQIGPSTIEGYIYTEDAQGKRSYEKNPLKSVAPALTLTIHAISDEDKPPSFNGAVGNYSFKVLLKSSPQVFVGDEMSLQIEIGGTGNLANVQLPDLCCQPGMSGIFKLSDLPPIGKVQGNVKIFAVNIRPLTASVKQIPPLEFSYYDPLKKRYAAIQSEPIAIEVKELNVNNQSINDKEDQVNPLDAANDWKNEDQPPSLIEIRGNEQLEDADLHNRFLGSWWALLFIPLAAGLLYYQVRLKHFLDNRRQQAPVFTSDAMFKEAYQEASGSSAFYAKFYQAFFIRLQERKDIDVSINSIASLPCEGAAGDVKAALTSLEESRYAGDNGVREKQRLKVAEELFKELKGPQ